MDHLPEGWRALLDGMALGPEPNTLIMRDGKVYGPQSVVVDAESYELPIWKVRTVKGVRGKTAKGIIPVREAYESFLAYLAPEPMLAREWDESQFNPPGSTSGRSIVVALDDTSITASFLKKVPGWFESLSRRAKAVWEEAKCPSNFVPDAISSITATDFVKAFSRDKFHATEHLALLNCQQLRPIPRQVIIEEHGARQSFLACLNATMAVEAIVRQQGPDDPAHAALLGALKSTFQPLWTSFGEFARKKLWLRRRALLGCVYDNNIVHRLISSDPLSEDVFGREAVDALFDQAARLAKSVSFLLGFQPVFKRKPQVQRGGLQKRMRGAYGGVLRQPGTPRVVQPRAQTQQAQSGGVNARYPVTPRRKGNRQNRGRGGRSPGTPGNTPGNTPTSAGRKENF